MFDVIFSIMVGVAVFLILRHHGKRPGMQSRNPVGRIPVFVTATGQKTGRARLFVSCDTNDLVLSYDSPLSADMREKVVLTGERDEIYLCVTGGGTYETVNGDLVSVTRNPGNCSFFITRGQRVTGVHVPAEALEKFIHKTFKTVPFGMEITSTFTE